MKPEWASESELGSSPLARGLPSRPETPSGAPRIIPARAGFTGHQAGQESHPGDHPRSRGVYSLTPESTEPTTGSSPLARGLRHAVHVPGWHDRIIPARAGFTGRACGACHLWRDHPRSRGVYSRSLSKDAGTPGSSPLARGLPEDAGHGGHHHGIIPARAGFTPAGHEGGSHPEDHPRSRGVYLLEHQSSWLVPGSSPLARGLPHGPPHSLTCSRIIPARAGFTRARTATSWIAPDHPRSRGVYYEAILAPMTGPGSSPLARGLLILGDAGLQRHGIIPARAGFTTRRSSSSSGPRDHPRSRGVYRERRRR